VRAEPEGNFLELPGAGVCCHIRLFLLIKSSIRTRTRFAFDYGAESICGMVLCLVEVRFVPKASRACQRGFADHSILPCSHLPASQRLPSAGAEDFGMGDEPWQRERAGRKRTACLCYVLAHPSREMLTDEGTPP